MLASKWKGGGAPGNAANNDSQRQESLKTGQIRSFRISKLDAEKKRIELELAG